MHNLHKLIMLVVASSLLVESQGTSHFCEEIKDETMTKEDFCTKDFQVHKNNEIPANKWKIDLEVIFSQLLIFKKI